MADRSLIDEAVGALVGARFAIAEASKLVPAAPGLYAVHADARVWQELGLGQPVDDRPLYIGKAERSLASRDLGTHFSTGTTGSSTLRRSLAALLVDVLDLRAVPRNRDKPERFANFGLEPGGDQRLTDWMVERLTLAIWPSPRTVRLGEVETAVLQLLRPPLNLSSVSTSWTAVIRSRRARLAEEARLSAMPVTGARELTTGGRVLGVDAAGKFGWLGVMLDDDGFAGARLGSLRELVEWARTVKVIGIDIPIGHTADGVREADTEARKFVGPKRASSVFATPPKEIRDAASYAEGNALLKELGRPMVSRQAWALLPKMLEAADLAAKDERVYEVHPEVSFCAMNGNEHLPWPKKSWNGLMHRRRLLSDAGIELPDEIEALGTAAADDLVDAAAVAWSARRIARGESTSLPAPPDVYDGRRVAIWY